ncbi:hypothetical protein [Wolbachia endosymbiont of Dactylopius coccus]
MFFLVTRWNDKVSVRRCHPSAYFFVIPVPRHWDPASFFLDSSVKHWNDTSLGLF